MNKVYLLILGDGRGYVGVTNSLRDRVRSHLRERTSAVGRAIQRHGLVLVDVLYRSSDREDALRAEVFFIDRLATLAPLGYNLTEGGEGTLGVKPSDLALELSSRRLSAAWTDPSYREKRLAEFADRRPAMEAARLEGIERRNSDPEKKQRWRTALSRAWTPERRAAQSSRARAQHERGGFNA